MYICRLAAASLERDLYMNINIEYIYVYINIIFF